MRPFLSASAPFDGRTTPAVVRDAPHPSYLPSIVRSGYFSAFRPWFWVFVPVLAIAAYVTSLRTGFLADDFMQVYYARQTGLDIPVLFASIYPGFLRPVGFLLIYQIGWLLWGYNPLPYHVIGLLLHAGSALVVGLWLARVARSYSLGWLASAIFAIFPLHMEAVGWVAAQFDAYSVFFGLSSLLCFTLWWAGHGQEKRRWILYAASLALYLLSIFTKESFLTFVPMFAYSAWLTDPPRNAREWRRLGYVLLPFCGLVALNAGVRFVKWGVLGGYGKSVSYPDILWDNTLAYVRLLISPINPALFGASIVQAVGFAVTVALLVGLVLYGRQKRRLLLFGGIWIIITLVPVLDLPPVAETLRHNRYLYLPSIGYAIIVAALLHAATVSIRRRRELLVGAVGVLMLSSIAICWIQLRPWHTATIQAEDLVQQLIRVVPPRPRPNNMVWYVENIPEEYKGVNLLVSGFGISRLFYNREIDYPNIERSDNAMQAPIDSDARDAYAVRVRYDERMDRFKMDYAAGITMESEPPTPEEAGEGLRVWDFRQCQADTFGHWQIREARSECTPGKGLLLQPTTEDPQIASSGLQIAPRSDGATFVRLRVSVRYPEGEGSPPFISEWFWKGLGRDFGGDRASRLPIRNDLMPHVYWTFVPVSEVGPALDGLRFDPVSAPTPAEVHWIALDLVK